MTTAMGVQWAWLSNARMYIYLHVIIINRSHS